MTGPWYGNPEWWQVILVIAGTLIAARAFLAERRAVRLTQRADVLLEKFDIISPGEVTAGTVVVLHYRNFGPTRASDVRVSVKVQPPRFGFEDIIILGNQMLASGERLRVPLPRLGEILGWDRAEGILARREAFRIVATIRFDDVFGIRQATKNTLGPSRRHESLVSVEAEILDS